MRIFHFSEDPSIERFLPHVAATASDREPRVWAIDEQHAPSYWFPRDCPRACCWQDGRPLTEPGRMLLGSAEAQRMHAIESGWLDRMRGCNLYRYELDPRGFRCTLPDAGYWTADEEVVIRNVEPMGDLVSAHAEAGIELRVVDVLWPVIDAVIDSGLGFSIIRKANLRPR